MENSENAKEKYYLVKVHLDKKMLASLSPETEYERQIAIRDLLHENYFQPKEIKRTGPYSLTLSARDNKIIFKVIPEENQEEYKIYILSFTPFKRIIKDYFLICESYYNAVQKAGTAQIEAIDMGRRGVHDEGSDLLMQRLEEKIKMDFMTARKVFTLICSLKWKGADISSGN